MGALLALMLVAADAEPAEVAVFDPASRWRMTLAIEGSASTNPDIFAGGALELGVLPLRFVRLVVEVAGMGAIPTGGLRPPNPGAFRLLGGVDGVLPLSWGELFAGIASGVDCLGDNWGPSFRLRAGADVLRLRPLVLGVDVGYGLISTDQGYNVNTGQVRLRIGVVF